MTGTEIREMSDTEIRERIEEIQEELFKLRFRSATQALENPTLLKTLRRDMARLKTVQTERSSAGEE